MTDMTTKRCMTATCLVEVAEALEAYARAHGMSISTLLVKGACKLAKVKPPEFRRAGRPRGWKRAK